MFFSKEVADFDAEIDLTKLGEIIAIERVDDETLITYIDNSNNMQEFNLRCNKFRHNALVEEFRLDLSTR